MFYSPDVLIDAVAQKYKVTQSELFGKSRNAKTAEARQMAMYFVFCYSLRTIKDIAEMFNKNTATIEYAIEEIRGRVKVDKHYKKFCNEIKAAVGID